MIQPNADELELARRLLAFETGAIAAYDKIHAQLTPLIGASGVDVLFVRSAKVTKREFAWLSEHSLLSGGTRLRDYLQSAEPPVATESIELLFATFFALTAALIGDRLMTQVLRRAWPTIMEKI